MIHLIAKSIVEALEKSQPRLRTKAVVRKLDGQVMIRLRAEPKMQGYEQAELDPDVRKGLIMLFDDRVRVSEDDNSYVPFSWYYYSDPQFLAHICGWCKQYMTCLPDERFRQKRNKKR